MRFRLSIYSLGRLYAKWLGVVSVFYLRNGTPEGIGKRAQSLRNPPLVKDVMIIELRLSSSCEMKPLKSKQIGDRFCIFTFFLFTDSELYLFNGFDFYFDLF